MGFLVTLAAASLAEAENVSDACRHLLNNAKCRFTMHDITIQNAIIIDGTGLPAYRADIAIKGDRIALIGKFSAKAKRTINAHGRTVIPGVIDPHSHADLILPLAPKRQTELMRCKLAQGVTTTVIGNCGLGCAPVAGGEAEGILRAVNAW